MFDLGEYLKLSSLNSLEEVNEVTISEMVILNFILYQLEGIKSTMIPQVFLPSRTKSILIVIYYVQKFIPGL